MARRLRWQTLIAIAGCGLVLLVLGYVANTSIGELRPDFGGTYVEGIVGSPMALNPLLCQFNDADKDLVALIFSGLTRLDERGEVVPELAEGWEVSADGRTYTLYLRRNVLWHDGAPFNADDVVFTVRLLQDPAFPGLPDLQKFWKRVSVKKLGDLTVEFTIPEPFAPFLAYADIGILPAHTLTGTPAAELGTSPFNARPVGTGPFMIKEASLKSVVLEAHSSYYRGAPYISQLVVKFYPDYPTAINALRMKQIQGLLLWPDEADAQMLSILAENKDLRFYTAQRPSYTAVFLNNKRFPFTDKAVRQALLYALDREQILDGPAEGQGILADSPILSGTWAFSPEVRRYEQDLDQARALMESAGWRRSGRGQWEKDGKPLKFSLMTNLDRTRVKIGEELVRQWRRFGVQVELSASGDMGLIENFLKPRRFDAILYGLDTGSDPDPYSAWHSSQGDGPGLNLASYADPQMDSILERARRTPQRDERTALYGEFQRLFAEGVPSILLYYPRYTYVVDRSVQGIEPGTLFEPSSRFGRVSEWYVKTKRVR